MERVNARSGNALRDARRKLSALFACFLLVMLFVGTNFMPEYSVDTYTYSCSADGELVHHALYDSGRPIQALALHLWDFNALSDGQLYAFFYWAGVALFAAAIYLLAEYLRGALCEDGEGFPVSLLVSFLIVFNPFVVQFFMFVETGVFALAVLLAVCAFLAFERYVKTGRAALLPLSMLLLLLTAMTYQVCAGLFVVLSLPFILKRSANAAASVKNNALVAVTYGVPMLAMLALTRFVFRSARFVDGDLAARVAAAVENARLVMHILPDRLFDRCVLALAAILAVLAIADGKRVLGRLLGVAYVCAGAFVVGILPQLAQPDAAFRMFYPMGAITGVLLLGVLTAQSDKKKLLTACRAAGLLVAAVFLCSEYAVLQGEIVGRYNANTVDRVVVAAVERQIERYERESGVEVTKVAFYTDQRFEYQEYAFSASWSDAQAFEVLAGRKLTEIEPKPEYAAYFAQQDYKAYDEDQIIFDGDELHLCRY